MMMPRRGRGHALLCSLPWAPAAPPQEAPVVQPPSLATAAAPSDTGHAHAVAALQVQIKALQADCAAAHARAAAAEARQASMAASYEMQLASLRHELMRVQGTAGHQGGGGHGLYIGPPPPLAVAAPAASSVQMVVTPTRAASADVTHASVPPPVAVTPPRAATDIALAIANASPTHSSATASAINPFNGPGGGPGLAGAGVPPPVTGGKQSLSAEVERLKRSVAQARAALAQSPPGVEGTQ